MFFRRSVGVLLVFVMTFEYSVEIGPCSRNKVFVKNSRIINSHSVDRYRIWTGCGDICLCADRKRRVSGLSGSVDKLTHYKNEPLERVEAMDGVIKIDCGIKLPEGVYICPPLVPAAYDDNSCILAFGDMRGDNCVKTAENVIVALSGGRLCGVEICNLKL